MQTVTSDSNKIKTFIVPPLSEFFVTVVYIRNFNSLEA